MIIFINLLFVLISAYLFVCLMFVWTYLLIIVIVIVIVIIIIIIIVVDIIRHNDHELYNE